MRWLVDNHFEEKPIKPKCGLIATACYIFSQRIFPLLSQYCAKGKRDNLGDFIAYLIDRDEVYAYTFGELWFDIGSIDGQKSA
jgi:glucose-1-phosphate thymidylyltransferase